MMTSLLRYLKRKPTPAKTDLQTFTVRRARETAVEVIFQRTPEDALRLGRLLFAPVSAGQLQVVHRADWDIYSAMLGVPSLALLRDGWIMPCDHCGKRGATRDEGFYTFCSRACRNAADDYLARRQAAIISAEQALLKRWKDARMISTNYAIAACRSPQCLQGERPIVSSFWLSGFTCSLLFCHGCNAAIVAKCDSTRSL